LCDRRVWAELEHAPDGICCRRGWCRMGWRPSPGSSASG
jgi:hypothetical protein